MTDEQTAGRKDNQPPPFESMSIDIEKFLEGARTAVKEHKTIETPDVAERMEGFLLQMGKFGKAIEKERKAENAPLNSQIDAINAKWKGLAATLEIATNHITIKVLAWRQRLKAKQDAELAEANRLKREADEKAAKALRDAEEQKRLAEAGDPNADPITAEIKAREATEKAKDAKADVSATKREQDEAKPRFTSGGRTRSVSVAKTYRAQIDNWKIAANRYIDHEWVKEAIQRAANEEVRKSMAGGAEEPMIPGITIITEESIRK